MDTTSTTRHPIRSRLTLIALCLLMAISALAPAATQANPYSITITSEDHATFSVGIHSSFTITTSGFSDPPSFRTDPGTLPDGLTIGSNNDGTGYIQGKPAPGTGGVYRFTLYAQDSRGSAAQSFTLTIHEPPAITSANNATFTVGQPGAFTVTTTGYPTPTLSLSGALPSGVTFAPNADGTATISGTPTVTGTFTMVITASNGVGSNATQTFTLTVQQAPAITSANNATFTAGQPGAFTVTTTGYPTPTLSLSGALPSGVTFTPHANGTATISGTPTATGAFSVTITASNGVNPNATQTFTLIVGNAPAITSADSATFTVGQSGSFTVTTTGYPTPTLGLSGTLPSGVTFTPHANGTATIGGTPATGSGGVYPLTITATNGISPDATQNFTLTITEAVAITSVNSATFTLGQAGVFTVTTRGYPTPNYIDVWSGTLPPGVTFTNNGDGTATISGTPTGNSQTYTFWISANNGVTGASQEFTLRVQGPPRITSVNNATFTVGQYGHFFINAQGVPAPTVTVSGALPPGVSRTGQTIYGTPAAGAGGVYPLTITASNGFAPDATQAFTLTVRQAPAITSATNTTFAVGRSNTFTVTTTGYPPPALTYSGALPSGVTFTPNANGTATISGTPTVTGTFTIVITASNGVGADATRNLTITVGEAPVITSANTAIFTSWQYGTFTVTATGYPTPTLSYSGALPEGIYFTPHADGTATIAGASIVTGTSIITITASNGVTPNAVQTLTLIVGQAPAITSANNVTFVVGQTNLFTVTTTGYPAPTLTYSGTLPSGVTFTPNADGTATISGTPTVTGTFTMVITASNGVGSNATQTFTLTVQQAPVITSASSAAFAVGQPGVFTVTALGSPTPTLTYNGALPNGVTFTPNPNGTATISGTATVTGTYTLTITATNGVSPDATQTFTLIVGQAPAITSANNAAFTVGQAGSFTVTAAGYPTPTLSMSGALPNGVTFTPHANGTATISGAPTAAGTFTVTITASNGVTPNATQTFTLKVQQAPVITSANSATFTVGQAGSFTVTAAGYPTPTLSMSGALPNGVTFTPHANGTATISGAPTAAGTFTVTITASNGVTPNATQTFTLKVQQAPVITSANSATFTVGQAGSFTVTAAGYPTPTLSMSGALPNGVTFTPNANGTATISGTPTAAGTFTVTITASNGVTPNATQTFTLKVQQAPVITSANSATFTVGQAGSFTVTAAGYPTPTLSVSGALPNGVTFTPNANGTATISGTPTAAGTFTVTITASNGVHPNTTQTFTLKVEQNQFRVFLPLVVR